MRTLLLTSALLAGDPQPTVRQVAIREAIEPTQDCLQKALVNGEIGVKNVLCETEDDSAFPMSARFEVHPIEGKDTLKSVQLFGADRLWFTAEEKTEGPCDHTVLVIPGYGETSTVYGAGDWLGAAFAGMDAKVPDGKLCVLGMNPAGKGTPGYVDGKKSLGAFGYKAMLAEHVALFSGAQALYPDYFAGKVQVLAHSMAGAYGHPILETLAENNQLERVTLHSPVGSGPLTGVSAQSLWRVRGQIFPALGQTLTGKGSIDLTAEERAKLMGEGPEEAMAQAPASGKEFFTWALGSKKVSKELKTMEFPVDLVLGEDESLIPYGMSRRSARALGQPYTEFMMKDTTHSALFDMTNAQQNAWTYLLSR